MTEAADVEMGEDYTALMKRMDRLSSRARARVKAMIDESGEMRSLGKTITGRLDGRVSYRDFRKAVARFVDVVEGFVLTVEAEELRT